MTTAQTLTERAEYLLREAAETSLTDPFAVGEVMLSTICLLRDVAEQVEARRTIDTMREMCRETSAGPDAVVER